MTTNAGVFFRPERRKFVASPPAELPMPCWIIAAVAFEFAIVLLRRARPPPAVPPQAVVDVVVVVASCLASDDMADVQYPDLVASEELLGCSLVDSQKHTRQMRKVVDTAAVGFYTVKFVRALE